jgi:hypothetical protein
MKHFQLRAGVVSHVPPFLVIIVFATQVAFSYCRGAALHAQSDSKARRQTQAQQQKVASPLNDLLDEAQRDIDAGNL